jgi:hypothetical protein
MELEARSSDETNNVNSKVQNKGRRLNFQIQLGVFLAPKRGPGLHFANMLSPDLIPAR